MLARPAGAWRCNDTAPRLHASIAVLAAAGVLCVSAAHAQSPTPRLPAGTVPVPAKQWVTPGSGAATCQGCGAANAGQLTVTQSTPKVILNWNSFDIAAGSSVTFRQPSSSAVALNRVAGGAIDGKTVIQGALNANGQVYLLNQNGILFDRGAQINVNTLLASTHKITDEVFQNGILAGSFVPKLTDGRGAIEVAAGATLAASANGKIMLLAPRVHNAGAIHTPDGQTVLAAGEQVYFLQSTEPTLRGIIVEVGNGGSVANLGKIVADRGNATLVGLAVNQSGRITASTSVAANGSIYLRARDNPSLDAAGGVVAGRTGDVLLAANSGPDSGVTEIRLDTADGAGIDSSVRFARSEISVTGKRIVHEGVITAPSGAVTIIAQNPGAAATEASIYVAPGARIDVAGASSAVLPMSRNQLEVELRGDELKDVPTQRDGVLRGKKVTIDITRGTKLADVSRQIAAVKRGIDEVAADGGSVTLDSTGGVVLRDGSSIDVSGGAVTYQSGLLKTTRLLSQGKVYDIGDAPADRIYEAILDTFEVRSPKWGITRSFDTNFGSLAAGFEQGAHAGALTVRAPAIVMDAKLRAATTVGANQRALSTAPQSGALVIGASASEAQRPSDVRFVDHAAPIQLGREETLPAQTPLTLVPKVLADAGFGRIQIDANGAIRLPAELALDLAPGSSVSMAAGAITIGGAIRTPGGSISLTTRASTNTPTGDLIVQAGAVLSVRGTWVNDDPRAAPSGSGVIASDAGSIALVSRQVGDLILGGRDLSGQLLTATLDVTGGGYLSPRGALTAGKGGNLTIELRQPNAQLRQGRIELAATILAQGGAGGGTLKLRAGEVVVRDGAPQLIDAHPVLANTDLSTPQAPRLNVPAWFFDTFGFSTVDVTDSRLGLTVAANTAIRPRSPYLDFVPGFQIHGTGSDILTFTRTGFDPAIRKPASIALNHDFGAEVDASRYRLTVAPGVLIQTDPKASITLTSTTDLRLAGRLEAPAGTVTVSILAAGRGLRTEFDPAQAVWLTADASIDVRGTTIPKPSNLGLRLGDVLPGGNVILRAERGYVVAEAGSRIDVSGAEALLDLPANASAIMPTPVVSNAGSVSVIAAEGFLADGNLAGKPGGFGAAGGTFSLLMTTAFRDPDTGTTFPQGPRRVDVVAGLSAAIPRGLAPGSVIRRATDLDINGVAIVKPDALAGGRFSRINLGSTGSIEFGAGAALRADASVRLDTPSLALADGASRVQAAYVELANNVIGAAAPVTPARAGSGTMNVLADTVDVTGFVTVHGADALALGASADVASSGAEIRFNGLRDANNALAGSLRVAGDVVLRGAQVYPTSATSFEVSTPRKIAIVGTGTGGPILSAGGALTLRANEIEQRGTLKAPLGTINLVGAGADSNIVLDAGSLTSVSADGQLIPYGRVQNGRDWVYEIASGFTPNVSAPPAKTVRVQASSVAFRAARDGKPAARIDVSGGGDVFAYEFVPGPGGSSDVLANIVTTGGRTAANESFAILPVAAGPAAPRDTQYGLGSPINVGDVITLAGGDGLPSGTYAVLPPRYALLPGAWLVTPRGGYQDLRPGLPQSLPDGTPVIAGKRGVAGTDVIDSRWSGYTLLSGTQVRERAEFRQYFANDFFTAKAAAGETPVPRLPADAGRLSVNAGSALVLDGELIAGLVPGARGAELDIAAPRLSITASNATAEPGTVQITDASLRRLGAESVLLGAVRTDGALGTDIVLSPDSAASEVVVEAGANLGAATVMLFARDRLVIKPGARVAAVAKPGIKSQTITVRGAALVDTNGDGVINASDRNDGDLNNDGVIDRNDRFSADGTIVVATAAPNVGFARDTIARARGDLRSEAGAVVALENGGTIIADATREHVSAATYALSAGASLSLGAGRITLGDPTGATSGLVIPAAQVSGFASLDALRLRSYSSIDLAAGVTIGSRDAGGNFALRDITFDTGGLNGLGGTAATRIEAERVQFVNSTGAVLAANPAPGGPLEIATLKTTLGPGFQRLSGFTSVELSAPNGIVGQGSGGLRADGDLVLRTSRLALADRAMQTLESTGSLTIAATPGERPVPGNAGTLTISGYGINVGSEVLIPAGSITLQARGSGDLVLSAGARLAAPGFATVFDGQSVAAPGGEVGLRAEQGAVRLQSGARVDVSGAPGSDAGRVTIKSTGAAPELAGELLGHADAVNAGGGFSLDAQSLSPPNGTGAGGFVALNRILADGGFRKSIEVRARAGDIRIAAGAVNRVQAHDVSLAADNGSILVEGVIDASGPSGGSIVLAASQPTHTCAVSCTGNVVLAAGAQLLAHATRAPGDLAGTVGDGGRVLLATSTASGFSPTAGSRIRIEQGATLDVHGLGTSTRDGYVTLRAPRTGPDAGTGIAIDPLLGAIVGAGEIVAEAVKTYFTNNVTGTGATVTGGNFNASSTGAAATDASNFMNQRDAIVQALGVQGLTQFHLRPGVELRSPDNLTISVNESALRANRQQRGWNLNAWRFAGEPGVLTVRAGGDIDIRGSISDGFVSVNGQPMPNWSLDTTSQASWSYRFTAGADLGAANPLAVSGLGRGDFSLGPAQTTIALNTFSSTSPTTSFSVTDPQAALVRTGTGTIDIAAGRDVNLGDRIELVDGLGRRAPIRFYGASVYTAGRPVTERDLNGHATKIAGFPNPVGANFPVAGGDITVTATGNVNGAITYQLGPEVVQRRGVNTPDGNITPNQNTAWWIDYSRMQQNFGTLGGGALTIRAGNDINNVSAIVPTTGRLGGAAGEHVDRERLVVTGGGDLRVAAGGNIASGLFVADAGRMSLSAGGGIDSGRIVKDTFSAGGNDKPIYTLLGIGQGSIDVYARGDVTLESVFNPSGLAQDSLLAAATQTWTPRLTKTSFFTYAPASGISVTSAAGDLRLRNDITALTQATQRISTGNERRNGINFTAEEQNALVVYPGSLRLRALGGNIAIDGTVTLFPSPGGDLSLLARDNITAGLVHMSDADPALLLNPLNVPSVANSVTYNNTNERLKTSALLPTTIHALTPVHIEDSTSARVTTLRGDISGRFDLAKPVRAVAGRDLRDLWVDAQNLRADDWSIFVAGRDVRYDTARDAVTGQQLANSNRIAISGPGGVQVLAERNVDLGSSVGVLTRGNLTNPALAVRGADIYIVAGARTLADHGAFIDKYFDPTVAFSIERYTQTAELANYARQVLGREAGGEAPAIADDEALRQLHVRVVTGLSALLTEHMRQRTGQPAMTGAEALAEFRKLPAEIQRPFVLGAMFGELRQAGRDFQRFGAASYARGYDAIRTLFPENEVRSGDVSLLFSQIKSETGGDINVLAPYGAVNAGQTTPPADAGSS